MNFPYTTERLFEDLFDFRRDFDEMFNRILTNRDWNLLPEFKEEFKPFFKGELKPEFKKVWNFTPALETYIDKDTKKFFCRLALPGIDPKDVTVTTQNNQLIIRGERKFAHRPKEHELFHEEIAYGMFERVLPLPEGVNVEKLNAEYVNGVLEITAPVAVTALPKKIEIKTLPYVSKAAA